MGIGPTKTLAKVANYLAKKKSNIGVTNICGAQVQNEVLQNFKIEDLWGVGQANTQRLYRLNIDTAIKLRDSDPKWIRSHFSVMLERMVLELRGISCLGLEEVMPRKNIMCSKSFGKGAGDFATLMEAISYHVTNACEKLRAQKSKAQGVYVFIQTNRFKLTAPQYENGKFYSFVMPTQDTRVVINAAKTLLSEIYKAGYAYHKAGILLTDLIDNNSYNQNDLFSQDDSLKSQKLMKLIDEINNDYGSDAIFFAALGTKRDWRMRAGFRSQRYTTNWKELITVT